MNIKMISIILLVGMLLAVVVPLNFKNIEASTGTIYVPGHYASMQLAVFAESPSESILTGASPAINLTVLNREGEPATGAAVFVYADPNEPPVNGYNDRTDDSGYISLLADVGAYTLAIASRIDNFYLVKSDITSPSTLTLYAADETVPVKIIASKLDGTPLASSSVYPTISKAYPKKIGSINTSGEATVYMTPYIYRDIFVWDWDDLYYLYHSGVAIPDGSTTLIFDAAEMPTGGLEVDLLDFTEANLTPQLVDPDETWTSPSFDVGDGSHAVLSEGGYQARLRLIKTDTEETEWLFELEGQGVSITSDSSVTVSGGGDFIISVEPDEAAYDPLATVTLNCLIADSFSNRVTNSDTHTPAESVNKDTVAIYESMGRDLSFTASSSPELASWQDNYPSLNITRPDGSVSLQEESPSLFRNYQFQLPYDAMHGEWVVTLSFDTGPHQGEIEDSCSFVVPLLGSTCGDVNDDGDMNMADMMTLWYDIADYPEPGTWTISNEWAADVNCDGEINMADVMILWYDVADYPEPGAWVVGCCE